MFILRIIHVSIPYFPHLLAPLFRSASSYHAHLSCLACIVGLDRPPLLFGLMMYLRVKRRRLVDASYFVLSFFLLILYRVRFLAEGLRVSFSLLILQEQGRGMVYGFVDI